jgi:fructoselysine-6-P-deglycase FrlB-like protein
VNNLSGRQHGKSRVALEYARLMAKSRYTAEWRGGDNDDKPWEWCVVDEWVGWVGSATVFGLTEEQAIKKAKEMNKQKEDCGTSYLGSNTRATKEY